MLNQKNMLQRYSERYRSHNELYLSLAQQNRGSQYATGYRCLVNFCTAFQRGAVIGYSFETSYALLAQDWGKEQSARTIKRHLCRLSEESCLLLGKTETPIPLTLFTKLEEVRRRGFLHVKLSLHPSFIVFSDSYQQALHEDGLRKSSI